MMFLVVVLRLRMMLLMVVLRLRLRVMEGWRRMHSTAELTCGATLGALIGSVIRATQRIQTIFETETIAFRFVLLNLFLGTTDDRRIARTITMDEGLLTSPLASVYTGASFVAMRMTMAIGVRLRCCLLGAANHIRTARTIS